MWSSAGVSSSSSSIVFQSRTIVRSMILPTSGSLRTFRVSLIPGTPEVSAGRPALARGPGRRPLIGPLFGRPERHGEGPREKAVLGHGPDRVTVKGRRTRGRVQVRIGKRIGRAVRRGDDLGSGPRDPSVVQDFLAKDRPA